MPFIIADIGACHDGRLDLALSAVRIAREAGADAIKFQAVSDPDQMARRRGHAFEDGYADVYRRYLRPVWDWIPTLAAECQSAGIAFMCTAYLPEDVPRVADYTRRLKLASFESGCTDMWAACAPFLRDGYEVIASLGLGLDKAVAMNRAHAGGYGEVFGISTRVKWLHCVSSYPADFNTLGLSRIRREGLDGFSDHASWVMPYSGALAVAAGATVLEKHLRLAETDADNPDAGAHALRPELFREYVEMARKASFALEWQPGRHPCEARMARYAAW